MLVVIWTRGSSSTDSVWPNFWSEYYYYFQKMQCLKVTTWPVMVLITIHHYNPDWIQQEIIWTDFYRINDSNYSTWYFKSGVVIPAKKTNFQQSAQKFKGNFVPWPLTIDISKCRFGILNTDLNPRRKIKKNTQWHQVFPVSSICSQK